MYVYIYIIDVYRVSEPRVWSFDQVRVLRLRPEALFNVHGRKPSLSQLFVSLCERLEIVFGRPRKNMGHLATLAAAPPFDGAAVADARQSQLDARSSAGL